jgi:hypothetical protein
MRSADFIWPTTCSAGRTGRFVWTVQHAFLRLLQSVEAEEDPTLMKCSGEFLFNPSRGSSLYAFNFPNR